MTPVAKDPPDRGYDPIDMQCIASAREVGANDTVLVGMGPPLLSGTIAKKIHAPEMVFVTEAGPIDWTPSEGVPAPSTIADPAMTEGSMMVTDMLDVLGLFLMGGRASTTMFQAAQIDRLGNLNTILVGTYADWTRRFPGTGGNVDGGASSGRMISTVPLESRRFREKVDFRTTAGYLEGPGAREAAGLRPQGPNVCVTTMCIFRFDTTDAGRTGSCEMYLDGLFDGVSVDDVKSIVPWDLQAASDLVLVPPPTDEELDVINELDAERVYRVPGRY
jgi:glutaconate CoA-transferase subunit B